MEPQLSVVIPAWNEAGFLPETLAALDNALSEAGIHAEVIVVDNASTDDTAAVAAAMGVRVIREPERKIARVRNAGAEAAQAPWLLFLDADTRVSGEHLVAVRAARDQDLAGAGATVALDVPVSGFFALGTRAWNGLSRRFRVAAGCFILARADLHRAIGGFDERLYAGDEIWYSRALRRAGRREGLEFRLLNTPPVVSSARKLDWYAPWQHFLVVLTFLLFPWAGRFRRLSWFWYRRPD
ncbi:glycosyltransferase [Spiribacter sp. 2438]|nr:glycosyltransferase [Spiribacter sp. 2438]